MRSRGFFVIGHEATIEINGGHPAIYVLDGQLLADLRSGPLPWAADLSAGEALCDLLEDAYLEYASGGQHALTDAEISEVSRTFEIVTHRLGIPAILPFRNFRTLDVYSGRFPSNRITAIHQYRQLLVDLFDPMRKQLAELRKRSGVGFDEELVARLRDPAASQQALNVDGELDEARHLGAEVLGWARQAARKAHEAEVMPLLPDLDMKAGRWGPSNAQSPLISFGLFRCFQRRLAGSG